jgi:serine/threonine-protein kinase HipA
MATGLHLNIDDKDNSLNYELAFEVIDFFQLSLEEAESIFIEILASVGEWREVANKIGIPRSEQEAMQFAFKTEEE